MTGLGYLLGGVQFFLVGAIVQRVCLDTAVVLFRIAETTSQMAAHEAEIAMNTANHALGASRESVPSSARGAYSHGHDAEPLSGHQQSPYADSDLEQ